MTFQKVYREAKTWGTKHKCFSNLYSENTGRLAVINSNRVHVNLFEDHWHHKNTKDLDNFTNVVPQGIKCPQVKPVSKV